MPQMESSTELRAPRRELSDDGQPCGAEPSASKLLAADALWEAAHTAEHVLDLPRSF
jgi:hypothetical protein